MGVMPINKLLVTMALPMILSMLVQALYNIVDSIFVAQLNEAALTAVSLAFPMQSLMIAVGVGTGVGINALLSRSLGEKNFDQANRAANNGIFLAICSCIVFSILGFTCSRLFFTIQTTDESIIQYGADYLMVIAGLSYGIFGQVTFERLLQSTGKTVLSMITQATGAIINIILDPILIFGLFGMPRLEVMGAAVATIIGQTCACILAIFLNIKYNKEITLSPKGMRPQGATIKRIYLVGIPSIIMSAIGSVMTFGMNHILMSFTSTATAVFGVYFRLQSFVFMPVFGLNNGMVPIVSYNYGARKKDRMMKTIKLGMIYASAMMIVGIIIFQILPEQLLMMFNASQTMLDIGVPALRIISSHFIFAAICIISISVLQATSHGFMSLWISVTRQLVVLLPTAYLLSLSGNINLVWLAFPIAEVASLTISLISLRHIYRKVIVPLGDPQTA
ncbi:MAG: MATE family efflux transporter [Bacillota bacterium]|nr:MATE family efflux transporter [Bacillota bacterium]